METNQETSSQPLPAWLSIPIILVCLFGGGWIIHWYVMTDALAEESHLLADAPAGPAPVAGNGGGWNSLGPTVRDLRNGRYALRATRATAIASLTGKHAVRLLYNNYNADFPGDDIKTLDKARLLLQGNDKAKIEAMKLTDDQMRKIRGIAQPAEAVITTQQRQDLLAAFDAWNSAATPTLKQAQIGKMRDLIDETAVQAMDATKIQIADRARKINEIITPAQWKIDEDMGGGK